MVGWLLLLAGLVWCVLMPQYKLYSQSSLHYKIAYEGLFASSWAENSPSSGRGPGRASGGGSQFECEMHVLARLFLCSRVFYVTNIVRAATAQPGRTPVKNNYGSRPG